MFSSLTLAVILFYYFSMEGSFSNFSSRILSIPQSPAQRLIYPYEHCKLQQSPFSFLTLQLDIFAFVLLPYGTLNPSRHKILPLSKCIHHMAPIAILCTQQACNNYNKLINSINLNITTEFMGNWSSFS